jgi:hypothetical protein
MLVVNPRSRRGTHDQAPLQQLPAHQPPGVSVLSSCYSPPLCCSSRRSCTPGSQHPGCEPRRMPGLCLRGFCPLLLQQQDEAPPEQQRVRQQAALVLPALREVCQALSGVLGCQLPACQGRGEQPQPEGCGSSGSNSSLVKPSCAHVARQQTEGGTPQSTHADRVEVHTAWQQEWKQLLATKRKDKSTVACFPWCWSCNGRLNTPVVCRTPGHQPPP